MPERKSRFGPAAIEVDEEVGFVLEPAQIEVGSGYTVSVSYDEDEKPVLDVKTYGKVDIIKLRREIERIFPDARIRNLTQTPSVIIAKKQKKKRNVKKK